ncbi:MAG TPA: hypothetical protein VFA18_18430 [Gemmataceae bacterium]|nr:hypothetical protein [Gemmataceae bacterium]
MIRYSLGLLAILVFAGSQAFGGELDKEFAGKVGPAQKAAHNAAQTQSATHVQVAAGTEMDRESPAQAARRGWGGWGHGGWGHGGWGRGGWGWGRAGWGGWGWGHRGWGWGWGGWGWGGWGWGWPGYGIGFYSPYYAWPVYSYGYSPLVSIGWSYPTWCW